MFHVGTVLFEVHDGARYLAGIPARCRYVEQGHFRVSGDDAARKVELHLLGDLEFKVVLFWYSLDDQERIVLAAGGVDPKGLGRLADVRG